MSRQRQLLLTSSGRATHVRPSVALGARAVSTCYIFGYVAFLGFPPAESQARWSCYCRITGEFFPRSGGLFYCMACSAGSHILYSHVGRVGAATIWSDVGVGSSGFLS